MLRRIHWYLQDWTTLAGLYEQAFQQATDAQALRIGLLSTITSMACSFTINPYRMRSPMPPCELYRNAARPSPEQRSEANPDAGQT